MPLIDPQKIVFALVEVDGGGRNLVSNVPLDALLALLREQADAVLLALAVQAVRGDGRIVRPALKVQ